MEKAVSATEAVRKFSEILIPSNIEGSPYDCPGGKNSGVNLSR